MLGITKVKAIIIDYSDCHLYELKVSPDKIIKLKWSKENFEANNSYFETGFVDLDAEMGSLRIYHSQRKMYDELSKTNKKIKKFDKYSFSINTENSKITHIYSYSDDWFRNLKDAGIRQTNSNVYKIKSYSDQTVIGIDEEKISGTGYEKELIIDLKNNTFKENYHRLQNFSVIKTINSKTKVCNNSSSSSASKRGNYLDYWWAIVLIGAIIFFIYTQTGRELKIKK